MTSERARAMLHDLASKLRERARSSGASEALKDLAERVRSAADTGEFGELVPGGRPSAVAAFAAAALDYPFA
ncbi:MAG: hypothetical protein HY908_35285 [Myxococcales bacterium]|nr:hypothetical protein [Myxococcales bacterium]